MKNKYQENVKLVVFSFNDLEDITTGDEEQ